MPRPFLPWFRAPGPVDRGAWLLRCLFGVGGELGGGGGGGGPPRKYYSLTSLGRETYETGRAEYLQFARSVRMLLEEAENE